MEYDKSQTTTNGSRPASDSHTTYPPTAGKGHRRVECPETDTHILSQHITFPFSGRVAKNRFLKAPMTERLCKWNSKGEPINNRGVPTDEYKLLYQRWGEGEIGVVVGGNLMVSYDAVEAFGNPILCDDHDGRVAEFREVCRLVQKHGSLFIAQLSHPGRQGGKALNPFPVSASDVHLEIKWAGNEFAKPRPLSVAEIGDMVRSWGETAYLCHQAGFDGVQVHCAHGYLLAQFISPSTNHRTDEYGGNPENRSRIVFEIIEEIRRRVSDSTFIICVKINSVEFQDKGTTPDDCKDLCVRLEEAKVDFVDLSGGTFEGRAFHHVKDSTKKREAYFIEFAEMIRPHLKKTKVYVTGGFRSARGMVDAIESRACDGVGIGRPLAAEPYLCKDILHHRVSGAIDNFVPLPLNTQASGTQLHQIARGHTSISDWSVEDEVQRWTKANEVETERKIKILPEVDSSGYPEIKAVTGFEYLL